MEGWGTDYVTIEMSGETEQIIVWFEGTDPNAEFSVSLVTREGPEIRERHFSLSSKGRLELDYSPSQEEAVVIIRNEADWASSNPSWRMALAAPLSVKARAEPTEGAAPLQVGFSASVSGGIPPYSYSWDFGDGSQESKEQGPVHSYSSAGTYSASLKVTDSWGDEKVSAPITLKVSAGAGGGQGGGGCSLSSPGGSSRDPFIILLVGCSLLVKLLVERRAWVSGRPR